MRVELGGDDWADLKDPEQVTNGDRRHALSRFYAVMRDGETAWAADMSLFDGYLEVLMEKWSLDLPLPGEDPSVMDRLSLDQSNRLYGAVRWLDDVSKPDFSPDGRADPKAGTGSSTA
jgi:hypothetical protein